MKKFDPAKDRYPLPEVTSYPEDAEPLPTFYTRDSEGDRAFEEGVEFGMRQAVGLLHTGARSVIAAWHHDLPADAPYLHHAVTALERVLSDPFFENRLTVGRRLPPRGSMARAGAEFSVRWRQLGRTLAKVLRLR